VTGVLQGLHVFVKVSPLRSGHDRKKTQKKIFFENHKLQQQENKDFRRKKAVYVPLDQTTGESLSRERLTQ